MIFDVYLTMNASTIRVFLQRAKCRLIAKFLSTMNQRSCCEWSSDLHFTTKTLRIAETRWPCGLRLRSPYLDGGSESYWGHGCSPVVLVVRCVGGSLYDGLIGHSMDSHRSCVSVCDLVTSKVLRPRPYLGCSINREWNVLWNRGLKISGSTDTLQLEQPLPYELHCLIKQIVRAIKGNVISNTEDRYHENCSCTSSCNVSSNLHGFVLSVYWNQVINQRCHGRLPFIMLTVRVSTHWVAWTLSVAHLYAYQLQHKGRIPAKESGRSNLYNARGRDPRWTVLNKTQNGGYYVASSSNRAQNGCYYAISCSKSVTQWQLLRDELF